MDVLSLLFLFVLAVSGWFWITSLQTLEIARNVGKCVCKNAGVQFLDDTVAGVSISLTRAPSGRRTLRRIYRFEFSETGNTRLEGQLVMLGNEVESVFMEPYRILNDDTGEA